MPRSIEPTMTREELQNLKTKMESIQQRIPEEISIYERIDSFVHSLYRCILDMAENTRNTRYLHKLQCEYDTFYFKYLDDIIESLSLRLVGCKIEKKILKYDSNGKLNEVNELSFGEYKNHLYIVIDWS